MIESRLQSMIYYIRRRRTITKFRAIENFVAKKSWNELAAFVDNCYEGSHIKCLSARWPNRHRMLVFGCRRMLLLTFIRVQLLNKIPRIYEDEWAKTLRPIQTNAELQYTHAHREQPTLFALKSLKTHKTNRMVSTESHLQQHPFHFAPNSECFQRKYSQQSLHGR